MSDLFDLRSRRPGIRLQRLEMMNWGTFDSPQGEVYIARPEGRTTLLVGRNGAGKSTLIDAILTLLVPSNIRNYNVAAGARKTERNENSYVRGACDQQMDADATRASKRYLRGEGKQYSALLACFHDEGTGQVFTVAQVLAAKGDGTTDKVFALADASKSIADDLAGLTRWDRVVPTLKGRGFHVTRAFSDYHGWFVRRTKVRPLAMDMFNQTVAVKDIRSLNDFIRQHMLEPSSGKDHVQRLLEHFADLRTAHRQLVQIRRQHDLLLPIESAGSAYVDAAEAVQRVERMGEALDPYFREATIRVFEPELQRSVASRDKLRMDRDTLQADMERVDDTVRRLRNEIEEAGGQRLREIPFLIQSENVQLAQKSATRQRFEQALRELGLTSTISTEVQFAEVRGQLGQWQQELGEKVQAAEEYRDQLVVQRAVNQAAHRELTEELETLQKKRTNLPGHLARLRSQICADLGLNEDDLPFAAELMAVSPEQREWESSIEMVLRSFALSLLVTDRLYRRVSSYVEQRRLTDASGRGQRLVYLRIGRDTTAPADGDRLHNQSLCRKLMFREGHPLLPWLEPHLRSRFDYQCCDTLEEFREAPRLAITVNRHMKVGNSRHEKDDRDKMLDPGQYVLGWDNKAKRQHLAERIAAVGATLQSVQTEIAQTESETSGHRELLRLIAQSLAVSCFDEIDSERHRRLVDQLEEERRVLEEANDAVTMLRQRLREAEEEKRVLSKRRDDTVEQIGAVEAQIVNGQNLLDVARRQLSTWEASGMLTTARESYSLLAQSLGPPELSADDIFPREKSFQAELLQQRKHCHRQLEPLSEKLQDLMSRFLKQCKEESADLIAAPSALPSFMAKLARIREESLPQYEERFRQRLNDTVTKEIGVFHSELQNEGRHIESKIEELNLALRELPYREGTFMRLEVRHVRNPEIDDFRRSLRSCLDDAFDDSDAANEARFAKIEALIQRLSEESTWRDRVLDVRRWYDFAAREIDAESGESRSCYEDSSGQSGGEKAKLAFTILVAAIAYQYDLDLSGRSSGGFHFVVVDEMFSKVDDRFAEYALRLFEKFGLQLIIVAPLDAKARVTETFVDYYLQVLKDEATHRSQLISMTAREYEAVLEQAEVAGHV